MPNTKTLMEQLLNGALSGVQHVEQPTQTLYQPKLFAAATAPSLLQPATATLQRNLPSQRVYALTLPPVETVRLTAALDAAIADFGFDPSTDGSDMLDLARDFARRLPGLAPYLARALGRLRHAAADAIYMVGLPQGESRIELLSLAMTWAVGIPFNYESQNGGALLMRIEPASGSAANTNTTADEFKWHTDDAALARRFRCDTIGLFGRVAERSDILTWFAGIRDLERVMGGFDPIYYEARFSVRMPISFNLGTDIWSSPVPILTLSDSGVLEIALPSYATRPADPDDIEAENALAKLIAKIDSVARGFAVLPGTALLFAQNRGLHARDRIGDARRALFRTYARSSLDVLRAVTGIDGHVFPITPAMHA